MCVYIFTPLMGMYICMCVFCMVHDCVHFTPQSRKATDTHCNDDCKEDLYLLQKKWESPPLMSSGLWMPLQVISLSLSGYWSAYLTDSVWMRWKTGMLKKSLKKCIGDLSSMPGSTPGEAVNEGGCCIYYSRTIMNYCLLYTKTYL